MSLQISEIVDAIATLEITGVRVRSAQEIRFAVTERDCPVLMPEPLNFIQNIAIERDSAGAPADARKTITYTLNYSFLYSPIGTAGRELEKYYDMVEKVGYILDAFIAADNLSSGTTYDEVVDITPQQITEFGPVPDPAGNQFIGCKFQIICMEFIN